MFKFLVCEGILKFAKGICQTAIMPLMILGVFDVEEIPEGIALHCIVAGNGPHVRELIA